MMRLRILLLLLLVMLIGCVGGGGDEDSNQLTIDAVGLSGVRFVWRGGQVDVVLAESHLQDVERLLGYSDTNWQAVVVIVEPFELNEQGQPFIDCVKALPWPNTPAFPRCHGYVAPIDGLVRLGFHLGFGSLEQSAFRFEANRVIKLLHHSPDWDCREYDKPPPNCFDAFVS